MRRPLTLREGADRPPDCGGALGPGTGDLVSPPPLALALLSTDLNALFVGARRGKM